MPDAAPLRRYHVKRVNHWFRRGSSTPVLVESDGGPFVVKLRGAGDGVRALIAEILVAELAEAMGFAVPERALLELPPEVDSDDRNDELRDLLDRSAGWNLGLRYLEGATELDSREVERLDPDFALRLLWLDVWVMNIDRTAANPNLLSWHGQPWLIDHGSALTFQHLWSSITESSPRESPGLPHHLFSAREPELSSLDDELRAKVTRDVLERAAARIPLELLTEAFPEWEPERLRAAYAAFLWKRFRSIASPEQD